MTATKKGRLPAAQQQRRKQPYVNRSPRSRIKLRTRIGTMLIRLQQPLSAADRQGGWQRFKVALTQYCGGPRL